MPARLKASLAALLVVAAAQGAAPAAAQGWVIGTGVAIYPRENAGSVTVERHSAPLWSIGPAAVGLAFAAQVDSAGGAWAGAGPALTLAFGASPWFLEASVLPGFHAAGARPSDLGGWLHIRSLIGLGYRLGEEAAIAVALDHRSNGNLFHRNPGEETLSLRLRLGF
ncbi:MAG: acyloxyacyl hydrolase [Rhodobacteraceae bacterium]|nr:acyloxyacyl hydrolase [Paracoccaceae bacterium]